MIAGIVREKTSIFLEIFQYYATQKLRNPLKFHMRSVEWADGFRRFSAAQIKERFKNINKVTRHRVQKELSACGIIVPYYILLKIRPQQDNFPEIFRKASKEIP